MRIKSALRQAKRDESSWRYWLTTTDPTDVRLRNTVLARAKKPSGKRKAWAMLVATHPRWRKTEPYRAVNDGVHLSGLFPKDPFHQAVIDGLVRDHAKQHGHPMTVDEALALATALRGGLPPIHPARGAEYADRIEYRIQQFRISSPDRTTAIEDGSFPYPLAKKVDGTPFRLNLWG